MFKMAFPGKASLVDWQLAGVQFQGVHEPPLSLCLCPLGIIVGPGTHLSAAIDPQSSSALSVVLLLGDLRPEVVES